MLTSSVSRLCMIFWCRVLFLQIPSKDQRHSKDCKDSNRSEQGILTPCHKNIQSGTDMIKFMKMFVSFILCVCVCVCPFFYFFHVWGTSQELLVAMRNPMFWGSQFVFLGLSHSSRSKERCNFTLFLFFTKATYLPGLIWNQIFRLHSFLFHLPMKLMEMWRAALFSTEQQDSAANICS